MKKILITSLFLLTSCSAADVEAYSGSYADLNEYFKTVPHNERSFYQSKKKMKKVFFDMQTDFYCGCSYDYKQIKGKEKTVVNPASCGYKPRKNVERGQYIEWEHVVPAHAFGGDLQCWREPICKDNNGKSFKGRKCCEKVDEKFQAMQADMYNLQPAVGELNADRSNFKFMQLPNSIKRKEYGKCEFYVYRENKYKGYVEPRDEVKGDIARTYFYMSHTYNIPMSDQQFKLFKAWDKADPISYEELQRVNRIEKIQGNKNPYVK